MTRPQPANKGQDASQPEPISRGQKIGAYSIHLYTASGVIFAFLAVTEICAARPDPRRVFVWLILATLIDSTDGPLARRWQVLSRAPRIAGRTIDDIVDYLTFTFIPLLLIWRMQWLPAPAGLWVGLAMMASLLGFANTQAKQEEDGFFLGFPSYWNIVAFYMGIWSTYPGSILPAVVIVVLSLLTVLPVRFLYPNLAPHPWRWPLLIGAAIWLGLLLVALPWYPVIPHWVLWLSLCYPLAYGAISVYLDWRTRHRSPPQHRGSRNGARGHGNRGHS